MPLPCNKLIMWLQNNMVFTIWIWGCSPVNWHCCLSFRHAHVTNDTYPASAFYEEVSRQPLYDLMLGIVWPDYCMLSVKIVFITLSNLQQSTTLTMVHFMDTSAANKQWHCKKISSNKQKLLHKDAAYSRVAPQKSLEEDKHKISNLVNNPSRNNLGCLPAKCTSWKCEFTNDLSQCYHW